MKYFHSILALASMITIAVLSTSCGQVQDIPNNSSQIASETSKTHSRPALLAAVQSGDVAEVEREIRKIWFFKHSVLNEDWGNNSLGAILDGHTTSYTLLNEAVTRGHVAVTELLLKEGAEVELSFHRNVSTPLGAAVIGGKIEIANLLLKYKASINDRAFGDWTCLHEAAKSGKADFVNLFLKLGSDPRIESHAGTPQDVARRFQNLEVAKILQDAEEKIPPLRPAGTLTEAIKNGNIKYIEAFLKLGDKPNPQTSLYEAMQSHSSHRVAIAALLLKYSPNPKEIANAEVKGYAPGAQWTLLHEAAMHDDYNFIDLLLKNGADPAVKFDGRNTPLDVAMGNPRVSSHTVRLLRQAMSLPL